MPRRPTADHAHKTRGEGDCSRIRPPRFRQCWRMLKVGMQVLDASHPLDPHRAVRVREELPERPQDTNVKRQPTTIRTTANREPMHGRWPRGWGSYGRVSLSRLSIERDTSPAGARAVARSPAAAFRWTFDCGTTAVPAATSHMVSRLPPTGCGDWTSSWPTRFFGREPRSRLRAEISLVARSARAAHPGGRLVRSSGAPCVAEPPPASPDS